MNYLTNGSSYAMPMDDDNDTTESVNDYLLRTRGPKHLSLNIVLPITVVYVFIFVTGVIGNIAVCLVIVRNNFMHTATNYYLFSLAVSDLTLLLLGKLENSRNILHRGPNFNQYLLIYIWIILKIIIYNNINIFVFQCMNSV